MVAGMGQRRSGRGGVGVRQERERVGVSRVWESGPGPGHGEGQGQSGANEAFRCCTSTFLKARDKSVTNLLVVAGSRNTPQHEHNNDDSTQDRTTGCL